MNDRPIANPQTVDVLENSQVAIGLTGQDGDEEFEQSLTFVLTSLPAQGTLSQIPGGPAIVGDLVRQSVEEVWQGEANRRFQRVITKESLPVCSKCNNLYLYGPRQRREITPSRT